mmetsp:Transcript_105728/g.268654  ORF Transcript_105728/g.268654 Transcript_105728/m.268654 type:complete len:261 (-) Transcript_105728:95-877(-)
MARALLILALLGSSAAAELSATCASAGAKGCAAVLAGEEDAGLGLLQQNAAKAADAKALAGHQDQARSHAKVVVKTHKHRQDPESTAAIWSQITGAIEIDQIQAAIANATNSTTIARLQEQLTSMQAQFPSAKELQAEFSDQWGNLTAAVNMQSLQAQIDAAMLTGNGSASLKELQAQFATLSAQMADINMTSIEGKAADYYQDLIESGVPLPDLDNLTAQASALAGQVSDMASSVASQATDMASSALGSVTDALGGFWR